nr:MAG TPA: hypothetical protein [Bacteriophage sp.]
MCVLVGLQPPFIYALIIKLSLYNYKSQNVTNI